MAASNTTSVAFIFKKKYSDRQVGEAASRDHTLLDMIRKEDGFDGDPTFNYPIRKSNPQGISGLFADAQNDASSSKGKQFAAASYYKYGVITLDGIAMAKARKKGDGAFYDLVTLETDGIVEEMGDRQGFELYRDGTGVRGIRSSESTDITTLTVADDARNFKEGMIVTAADASDGGTPRTGSTDIVSVDEDAGTIGLDTSDITGYVDGDYLFANGDDQTSANGCMEGLAALFPLTAPAVSESFRGVDRSSDPRRYAGIRVDNTANTIEENIGLVGVKIGQTGKRANVSTLNPINFWQVARRLNAKVEYQAGGGTADYGFQYIMVHTPAGVIKVYSDPDCPTTRGYVLNLETLYIKHLEAFIHVIRDDGKPSMRQVSADGLELRIRTIRNLISDMPAANGVFSI